jgi:hypothetical protein
MWAVVHLRNRLFFWDSLLVLEVSGSYWSLFTVVASSAYLLALATLHALAPGLTPVNLNNAVRTNP